MARNDSDEPTWLYQARCAHGGLLYVGIAYDVQRRVSQHRSTKSWWPEVDTVFAQRFETRAEAARLESAIIAGERPRYNIAGVRPHVVDPTGCDWVLLSRVGDVIQSRADV